MHKILWADDDADDLSLFREIMEAYAPDHKLVEFTNGKQLLNYLQESSKEEYPCLVVLDMNMPVMSGRDTLRLLRGEPDFENIPVVIFTTSGSRYDAQFCKDYRSEMITKPAAYNQLKDAIVNLVGACKGIPKS